MKKIKRMIYLFLVVGWCLMIYAWSHQMGKESQAVSEVVADLIYEDHQFIGFWVRKAAHLFEFFMLALWVMLFLHTFAIKYHYQVIIAFTFCVLYAISDEIHQTFIPGRYGSFMDCLIDSLGSVGGIIVFSFFNYYKQKRLNVDELIN